MPIDSVLYLPFDMHTGAIVSRLYAPMLSAPPPVHEGLEAFVQTETLGTLHPGLYLWSGKCWRFALPQYIVSELLLARGGSVSAYMGPASVIPVPNSAMVFKNGVLTTEPAVGLTSIFCVVKYASDSDVVSIFARAAQALSGHRVLKATIDGANYASSDVIEDASAVIGISVEAASAGALIQIQTDAELSEPSWNWAVGKPVFNGLNGLLTQTSPSAGYSLVVGLATSPTTILISVKQPIIIF